MSRTLYNINEDSFLYYSNLHMLTHSLLSCHLLTTAISYFLMNITPYRIVGGMDIHFLKFLVPAFTFENWSAAQTNFFISTIYSLKACSVGVEGVPRNSLVIWLTPQSRALVQSDKAVPIFSFLSRMFHKLCQSCSLWFHCPNISCWEVQITKILFIQFSPGSFYFYRYRSRNLPQHPILQYLQPALFQKCETPCHTHIKCSAKFYFYFRIF